MGNLRDQLKKIKNALGLGRDNQKPTEPTAKKGAPHRINPLVSERVQKIQVKLAEPLHQADKKLERIKNSIITETAVKKIKHDDDSANLGVSPPNSGKSVQADQLRLPVFTSSSRVSEFKTPDAWVARGVLSQLSTKSSGPRSDIFIGLDFGTAFTKAAVQILDNIYPIDWDGVAKLKEKYLLPTKYSETKGKFCYLGQHPDVLPEALHANLKRGFITQRVSDSDISKAIVFIALVLQYVRGWIYHHHAIKLGSASIGWYFNIGIPSDVLDKDKHARQYKKLADIAWSLSLRPQSEITFENAFQSLSQPIQHDEDVRDVCMIPELVAQLSGYSKSARRQNGLHTLIDIGGGTVDMVTFNVHQADGDDVFPFFVSEVKPLGSYALLENRFSKLSNNNLKINFEIQNILSAEVYSKIFDCAVSSVKIFDQEFFKNFQREFEAILGITYRRRYPSSPNWKLGIRTFISGGGAFIPGYADAIQNSHRPLNCPLLIMDLPPHPKIADFHQNYGNYSRISVACGLAVDAFSLGAIRPASEVDDATPLITTVNGLPVRERLDRDELYPK